MFFYKKIAEANFLQLKHFSYMNSSIHHSEYLYSSAFPAACLNTCNYSACENVSWSNRDNISFIHCDFHRRSRCLLFQFSIFTVKDRHVYHLSHMWTSIFTYVNIYAHVREHHFSHTWEMELMLNKYGIDPYQ